MIKKSPEDTIFDRAIEAEVMDKAQKAVADFEDQIKELEKTYLPYQQMVPQRGGEPLNP
ncbi:MAG: hypothetical protein JRC93_13035 [Deltaproteobacteria bacterium]|nr:hypothetical protein [Deltaproteobacteria bacterium]